MMQKTLLFLFLLLPLSSFTGLHKFYVSVTDVEYNSANKSLQVISRVFTDDMENLLRTRYGDELRLDKEAEHPAAEEFLEKYVTQKFKIHVNDTFYPLRYLGKKYDHDQIVIFIEVEQVPSIKTVKVINEILMDAFPGQKNVVHVEYDGMTKSLLLTRNKDSGIIDFSR